MNKNKWRTSENWHYSNDREEERVENASLHFTVRWKEFKARRTMASKQRRINKHVSWNRCFQRVEKGKQIRTKRSPYGSTGPIKTILYASVKVPVHSHNQTATAHTLDNQRYTRTAFALCLNDVISCLYLPFITAVSFPPAAPPRERYPGSR